MGEAVADNMIKALKKRGEHYVCLFREIRAIAVQHQNILLLNCGNCLNNSVPFAFSGLGPYLCPVLCCYLWCPVGAVPVNNENMRESLLLKGVHQFPYCRCLVKGWDKDADRIPLDFHP